MGKRRLSLAAASDDDDDDHAPLRPPRRSRSLSSNEDEEEQAVDDNTTTTTRNVRNRRKKMKLDYDDEDEEEVEEEVEKKKKRAEEEDDEEVEEVEEEVEEEAVEDAKPVGDVLRTSGKGRWKRLHFNAFEYDGLLYELEDPVLLVPEEADQKPYVAIIKDISQDSKGSMKVMGQWFYRPEEAEKKGGGNWQSRDTRELFYSFHRDEIPAESVMHKCLVHFIPLHKQIPSRQQHPGFIVQKVYDTEGKRLFKLTDKDYEDNKQEEIDLLVQKTLSRLGDLPDLEPEDIATEQENQFRSKRLMRRKNMAPLDVSREDEGATRSGQSLKPETPGSCASNASEYYIILFKSKVLTGETHRDKWLEKLLQGLELVCTAADGGQTDDKEKTSSDGGVPNTTNGSLKTENESEDKNPKDGVSVCWPDKAVLAVVALESAAHEAFSSDFQKYNQKMRQMTFNLKSNATLSQRLLNAELEPSQILYMSPTELKEGLTADEIASRQPEESQHMQMTDTRCNRCSRREVCLNDIIQTGTGDRYQLECLSCGNAWYASRDEAASLTVSGASPVKNVETSPSATAKSEDVEKVVSPSVSDKAAVDDVKKTSEASVPVLDNQSSFNKATPVDNPGGPDPE